MSREILFRGWCPRNEKWIEGDVIFQSQSTVIRRRSDAMSFQVEPFTVCQYTGLTDRTGVKIWENDIVRIAGYSAEDRGWIRFGSYSDARGMADTNYGWFINFIQNNGYYRQDFGYWAKKMIVIGNYFDTPELLE